MRRFMLLRRQSHFDTARYIGPIQSLEMMTAITSNNSSQLSVPMSQPAIPRSRRMPPKCTHHSVTRLWDEYDCLRCSECHRPSQMGFVYRCTQETDLNLPDSDFVDLDHEGSQPIDACRPSTADRSVATGGSSSVYSTSAGFAMTLDINSVVLPDKSSPPDWQYPTSQNIGAREAAAIGRTPTLSTCEYMVCPACRPVFRDRAWQSINTIVHNQITPPSQFELDNRPISSAHILVKMEYILKRLSSGDRSGIMKSSPKRSSSVKENISSKTRDEETKKTDSPVAGDTNPNQLASLTQHVTMNEAETAPKRDKMDIDDTSYTKNAAQIEQVTSQIDSDPINRLEPITNDSNRPIQSSKGRAFRDSVTDLLKPRNRASLLNSSALYNQPAENRSTSLVIDEENREARMSRKPTKGRWYIEDAE